MLAGYNAGSEAGKSQYERAVFYLVAFYLFALVLSKAGQLSAFHFA
jgi:hypothetical protein